MSDKRLEEFDAAFDFQQDQDEPEWPIESDSAAESEPDQDEPEWTGYSDDQDDREKNGSW